MDWTHRFYHRQNELTGIYTGDIEEEHHHKASLITAHHPTVKTVLELGAGGGQIACATALAGLAVTAIELTPSLVEHARALVTKHHIHNLTMLNADFYTLDLQQVFDVITYWDGFGIGTDEAQIALLHRCEAWLADDGVLLMDVMTPWYWAYTNGQTMHFGEARRRYGFDALSCRMTDTWWHQDTPEETVTQLLRCYSPADLRLLLKDTRFVLEEIVETGGAVEPATGTYTPRVELGQAMSYVAKLRKH